MKKLFALIVAASLTSTVFAHGGLKAAHGGPIAEGKAVTLEVTIDPAMSMVYLTDHGKPVDSKGTAGEIILLNGGAKSSIKLQPSGGNSLMGAGAKLGPGAKAIVKVNLPGKGADQVRVAFP